MEENIQKTEGDKVAEEKQARKNADLEYLANILPKIVNAKEKLERLNMYIEKYEDTFMEWQNIYDKKDLDDSIKKIDEIIYRISSVNKI